MLNYRNCFMPHVPSLVLRIYISWLCCFDTVISFYRSYWLEYFKKQNTKVLFWSALLETDVAETKVTFSFIKLSFSNCLDLFFYVV